RPARARAPDVAVFALARVPDPPPDRDGHARGEEDGQEGVEHVLADGPRDRGTPGIGVLGEHPRERVGDEVQAFASASTRAQGSSTRPASTNRRSMITVMSTTAAIPASTSGMIRRWRPLVNRYLMLVAPTRIPTAPRAT